MSVIGVVSSVTKEPTQSQTGGTDFPRPPKPLSLMASFPQIGAFAFLYLIRLSWTRLEAFSM